MTSSSSYSKFPKSVWLSSHLCRDGAIENGTDEYAMEKNSHLITTIHHIKSEHLASSAALCFTARHDCSFHSSGQRTLWAYVVWRYPEIATKLADLVVAGVQRDPTAIVDHWEDQYLLSLTANGRSLLFSQILH